jgi:hypothetical protein
MKINPLYISASVGLIMILIGARMLKRNAPRIDSGEYTGFQLGRELLGLLAPMLIPTVRGPQLIFPTLVTGSGILIFLFSVSDLLAKH